jgi:DNA-directed RNA polymerase sigma subunit (sigma70/sigma32)
MKVEDYDYEEITSNPNNDVLLLSEYEKNIIREKIERIAQKYRHDSEDDTRVSTVYIPLSIILRRLKENELEYAFHYMKNQGYTVTTAKNHRSSSDNSSSRNLLCSLPHPYSKLKQKEVINNLTKYKKIIQKIESIEQKSIEELQENREYLPLIQKYKSLRRDLIAHNTRLAYQIAIREIDPAIPLEERISISFQLLILAIDNYIEKKSRNQKIGCNFTSFIGNYIGWQWSRLGRIENIMIPSVMAYNKMLRLGGYLRKLSVTTDQIDEQDIIWLIQKTSLTEQEITSHLAKIDAVVSIEELEENAEDKLLETAKSISTDLPFIDTQTASQIESDLLAYDVTGLLNKAHLSSEERRILTMYYGLEEKEAQPLRKIAQKEGCSHEYIRQIKQKAISRVEETPGSSSYKVYVK